MLTNQDRQVYEETGLIPPDRLRALQHALRALSADAREASRLHDKDSQFAAALRGKKLAYAEAAHMIDHILNGQALHPRRYSSASRKSREWGTRRAARSSGGAGV